MILGGGAFLIPLTIFYNIFTKYANLEMALYRAYKHEAYVSGIGLSSIFNQTKIKDSKNQTFYFSGKTDAGKLIGFQLTLTTTNKIYIERFMIRWIAYLHRSVIRGPMTVLMHRDSEAASISRYLFIRTSKASSSKQKFHVVINAQNLSEFIFIRLIGTATSTMEYKLYRKDYKFTIKNDANIGDLTGIAIRLPAGKYDFPYFKHVTVTHNGKTYSFVFDSKITGPATFIKFLDSYESKCQWTTWTEITLNTNELARQRKCYKYGVAIGNCDTCTGDFVEFVQKGGLVHRTRLEGQKNKFYGVVAVLVISILVNFSLIALAVYYRYFRRQVNMPVSSKDEVTETTFDVTTEDRRDSF